MGNTKAKLQAVWRRDVRRKAMAGGLHVAAALAGAGLMAKARGRGALFTLHHVRPKQAQTFEANAHLEVTPEFLDAAIARLKSEGYDFIPLADVPARMASPTSQPFAVFTLDDGYRNNQQHALPVFARHNVPFTVFIAQGFAERTHSLWWETLAVLLNQESEITFDFGQGPEMMDLGSRVRKLDAFDRFARHVRSQDEVTAVAAIDALCRQRGIDPLKITAELTMDREELKRFAADPLVSLGAHTVSHRAVGRLSADVATAEMRQSAEWLEALTGQRPRTIAYPYGDPASVTERDYQIALKLGFEVAVTTQPGTLGDRLVDRLTGLPRISLNGFFQEPRYVSALASGIPFSIGR
jgi:peptidoglycan/xylan/chitin deacetylase (PgdA/CDA1 family)